MGEAGDRSKESFQRLAAAELASLYWLAWRLVRDGLERAGFDGIWVGGHRPFGIDEAVLYPLFTPELIEVMRRTIPAERQGHVATGVIVKARRPG